NKADDAKRLGADEVVISKNADEMRAHTASFDFILDTVSADHDLNAYLALLKLDGTMTLLGVPPKAAQVAQFNLIAGRRSLAGSGIGSLRETQEMLDFCAEHGITSDVENIWSDWWRKGAARWRPCFSPKTAMRSMWKSMPRR
ncbi:MAG TPA: zinc-binding dehydrogenase, partial [Nitrospiraceae bacterium]|nr:zinc-binding dehydrogenase [Nitrospiraceae bacterium]